VDISGQAAGAQFLTWLLQQDLPEQILANPACLCLPIRGDVAVAILSSVLNRVQHSSKPDRWEAGRDVLGVAFSQCQEIAIAAHGKLWKCKPDGYMPKARNGVFSQMNQFLMGAN
jgi:hypothetical protein